MNLSTCFQMHTQCRSHLRGLNATDRCSLQRSVLPFGGNDMTTLVAGHNASSCSDADCYKEGSDPLRSDTCPAVVSIK